MHARTVTSRFAPRAILFEWREGGKANQSKIRSALPKRREKRALNLIYQLSNASEKIESNPCYSRERKSLIV